MYSIFTELDSHVVLKSVVEFKLLEPKSPDFWLCSWRRSSCGKSQGGDSWRWGQWNGGDSAERKERGVLKRKTHRVGRRNWGWVSGVEAVRGRCMRRLSEGELSPHPFPTPPRRRDCRGTRSQCTFPLRPLQRALASFSCTR